MATGLGMLRWWTSGASESSPTWHLRYGNSGPALCDITIMDRARHMELRSGPPGRRCPLCSDVVKHQLGIDSK